MTAPSGDAEPLAGVVERNIEALIGRRRKEAERRPFDVRVASGVSGFAGTLGFVYVHLLLIAGYVAINIGITPFKPFDPAFAYLGIVASVEGVFLWTFILINQKQEATLAEKRAELSLQISLLSEHEITHMIKLLSEIGEHIGVKNASNPALDELKRDVAPEMVLDHLDRKNEEDPGTSHS